MEPRTLEALQSSIAKWDAIAAGTGVDQAADNCALCKIFQGASVDVDGASVWRECAGCPVMERTGKQECEGSPYYEFRALAKRGDGFEWTADTEEARAAAGAMRDGG